jgi:RHH-type transcriptional regulator, rel operon repressor / antitoxin RelB
MLAIRLPPEIEKQLERLAKKTGRTKTFYAREAILTYLEDLEDAYIAEKAWKEFKKSGEKTVSLEEVMKEHGMGDKIHTSRTTRTRKTRSENIPANT